MTEKRKVYIVNENSIAYGNMFRFRGWDIVNNMEDADIVQFVGGADVSPSYYNQHTHSLTHCDPRRDEVEKLIFLHALHLKKPMAGICRGGQFLNIMCGGSMWQEVKGHRGAHEATFTDLKSHRNIKVTSTHHQMMVPVRERDAYTMLMTAALGRSRTKCSAKNQSYRSITIDAKQVKDVEALHYTDNNCLCFQPHPEFEHKGKLSDLYFFYIHRFLLDEEK